MSCGDPHETPCSEVLDAVYLYLDGEQDAHHREQVRIHLDECAPCLRQYGLEQAVKALVARCCGSDRCPKGTRDAGRVGIVAGVGDQGRAFDLSPPPAGGDPPLKREGKNQTTRCLLISRSPYQRGPPPSSGEGPGERSVSQPHGYARMMKTAISARVTPRSGQ